MTFLKFAAIYVSLVSLFLFYLPFCFLFPVAATLAPRSPFLFHFGSTVVSLSLPRYFSFFSLPLDLTFPSFVLFHPLVATLTAYIDLQQRLEKEKEEEEEEEEEEEMEKREISLSLSLFLDESYFYLPSSSCLLRMSE